MGLGYALTEEVHFKDDEVRDHNSDSYPIPMPMTPARVLESIKEG